MQKQLEKKHLAPYECFDLKVLWMDMVATLVSSDKLNVDLYVDQKFYTAMKNIKPILRPLDLSKPITHKGETFVPMQRLDSITTLTYTDIDILHNSTEDSNTRRFLPIWIIEKLHEWLFDTQYLLESGLAISVDSLTVNPYEIL